LLARADARLTAPGPAYRLIEVHTLVALVIGLRLATRDWTLVAARPAVLTDGLSVMSWLPTAPPALALTALQVVGLGGVVLVVARRRAQAGFVVAWCAYTALAALWGSSGKVMHNDVLTVTVGFVLLFARPPAPGEVGSRVRWGWPPRAALVVLGAVYLTTGLQKVRHSGLDWVFSDNMAWILRQGSSPYAAGLSAVVSEQPLVSRSLAGGALLLELSAPLWLAVRRTRIPFALAVAVMHLSIWLLLGLDYSAWWLTVAAVAVPLGLPPGRRLVDVPGALRVRWPVRQPS